MRGDGRDRSVATGRLAGFVPRRRQPSRNDRGAAAVEFALLMPIALAVLFGIVSAGLAYFHKVGLASDVREAGRYGATYLTSTGGTADSAPATFVDQVYQTAVNDAGDTGDLHVTGSQGAYSLVSTDQMLCVAYVSATGSVTRKLVGTAPLEAGAGSMCFDDGLGSTAGYGRVQVASRGFSEWNLLVFPGGPNVSYYSQTVYRYERSQA